MMPPMTMMTLEMVPSCSSPMSSCSPPETETFQPSPRIEARAPRQGLAGLVGVLGAHPGDHGRGGHLREGDARRVVMREHGGHVEGALRLGDADDAHRDTVARMQDDRNLVDGGAPQLIPESLRNDDRNQALVGSPLSTQRPASIRVR